MASESKDNHKWWWSLIKQLCKNSDVADEHDDDILTGDLDKAEAVNKYFSQASCLKDSEVVSPENALLFDNGIGLDNIYIAIHNVADQIQCIYCSKSYGPDGIHPLLLKGGNTLVSVQHTWTR